MWLSQIIKGHNLISCAGYSLFYGIIAYVYEIFINDVWAAYYYLDVRYGVIVKVNCFMSVYALWNLFGPTCRWLH